jgi:hypothetical protein
MIQRAGYGDLHSLLERFSEEVLPTLPGIKFAFVDSSHLFDLILRFRSEIWRSCKRFQMIGAIGGFIRAFSVTRKSYANGNRLVPLRIPPKKACKPRRFAYLVAVWDLQFQRQILKGFRRNS